jgi:hypothetical protein
MPSAREVVLADVPEFLFVALDGSVGAGGRPVTRRASERRWAPCMAWATA